MRQPCRASLVLSAVLAAASALAGPGTAGELAFEPVPVPATAEEKATWRAATAASLDGRRLAIGFTPLLESGKAYGAGVFGRVTDFAGKPVLDEGGKPLVSAYADFTSILKARGELFAVTHFESLPSALYLSRLAPARGTLSVVETRPLNLGFIGGIYNPCAGVVTPWGTHLGGEEYPPDARAIEAAAAAGKPEAMTHWVRNALRYHGIDARRDGFDRIGARFRPYRYGFPFEITVRGWRNVGIVRHHAMGRFSHELAYVMPDRRTVYMSDDGDNTGLFMFVADRAGDLTAGRLFAARFTQSTPAGASELAGSIGWIDLGHARSAPIAAAIEGGVTFARLFETAVMAEDGSCPTGFGAVNFVGDGAPKAGECLQVRPGREVLASRLETRRYAALKGATTELSKGEGITYDPRRKRLYLALARIERGMEDGRNRGDRSDRFERGSPNHLRLAYNRCGMIAALDLGRDARIGSDHVARAIEPLLVGRADTSVAGNTCALDGIAEPDNITFMPEHDTLVIAEDSSGGHENDAIWAYDVERRRLQRIMTMPLGAEASGIYWHPDVAGAAWLTAVVQHPFARSGLKPPGDEPRWKAAVVGVIGPFPRK